MSRDPRVDAYIQRQADFARPILTHIRQQAHDAVPGLEEALKWGAPAFLRNGKQLAIMAGFKAHAVLNFAHGTLVVDEQDLGAMGQFGRLTGVGDLPPDETLRTMFRKAAELIDKGVKPPRTRTEKAPLETPDDLRAALDGNAAAAATFDGFTPSARREYVEWVLEAKRPETRSKRIAQAVEWMAEGKKRNWKYESC